jgi:cytochrome c oxidase assembly protein subunit 15
MPAARSFNLPHIVACLLVAATAVLLSFGALVTTYEAAMAVPDWPATYGHNMFLFPLSEWLGGPWDLFLEHGHRLLGALVGMITLALAAVAWRTQVSPWVRALSVAAVLLVIVQGGLGGARVLLDDTTVAKVHACTGPLFFGVAVALAVFTRRSSASATVPRTAVSFCAAVPVAAYAQLVAGAQLRHLDPATPPAAFHALVGTHVLLALVVASLSVVAAVVLRRSDNHAVRRWALVVVALVSLQIVLGFGTWVAKYGVPSAIVPESWRLSEAVVARSSGSAVTVTSHAVLGMIIFGVGVAVAILAARCSQPAEAYESEPAVLPRRGGALV